MSVNDSAFDRFSAAHFVVGYVKRSVGLSLETSVLLSVVWELMEDELKDRWPHLFPHSSHDSKANALGDVVAMVAGWEVRNRKGRR